MVERGYCYYTLHDSDGRVTAVIEGGYISDGREGVIFTCCTIVIMPLKNSNC